MVGVVARGNLAALPWDALKLVEAAIPAALKSARPGTVEFREALRTALENCKGVVGVSAVYTMSGSDHSGINQLGMSVVRIEKGKWRLDQSAAF